MFATARLRDRTKISEAAGCNFSISLAARDLVDAARVQRQWHRNRYRRSAAGLADAFGMVLVVASAGLESRRRRVPKDDLLLVELLIPRVSVSECALCLSRTLARN